MFRKIVTGAVIAVLLLGGEALFAEKSEGKTPPCEAKADAGCPKVKIAKPAPPVKPKPGPRPNIQPGHPGPRGPMGGPGLAPQHRGRPQGPHPQMGQMRRRFGQAPGGPPRAFGGFRGGFGGMMTRPRPGGPPKGARTGIGKPACPRCAPGKPCDKCKAAKGPPKPCCPKCKPGAPCPQCKAAKGPGPGTGGPGRAFGGFGLARARAFGGFSSRQGPHGPMGFMRGRCGRGFGFGAAMRLHARRAGFGRPGMPRISSRFGRGHGPSRGRPAMRRPHRGGRSPSRGGRGPHRGEHGPRRRGPGGGPQGRHGRRPGGHR